MDTRQFFETLWFFMYPLLLIGSVALFIQGFLRRRLSKSLYHFSCIFLSGVILGYGYYLTDHFTSSSDPDFFSATLSFYSWFSFVALWLLVIGILLTILRREFLKLPIL